MNVLSLFDGMSCGQIALERAGIKVSNYFSSEIDKHTIKVTEQNYPNTIQVGDVVKLKGKNLPKIDLLIGGSPCQGFTSAGKRLNFKDPRSKLFFEFLRLKEETNPKYWLLENVKMTKECQKTISKFLGVEPIKMNSKLVSAQSRERLYWTNIPVKDHPEDKGIVLKDIVQKGLVNSWVAKRYDGDKILVDTRCSYPFVFLPSEKHSSPNGLIFLGGLIRPPYKLWANSGKILQRNFRQRERVYSEYGKTATLSTLGESSGFYEIEGAIRRLTKIECERLQTVPDNYTKGVSDTQAIKMLGNGWTIDIIVHFFKNIN